MSTDCSRYRGQPGDATVAFKGIAYAQAPVGERRWQGPLPADCGEMLYEVQEFAPACAQLSESGELLSDAEDCLYLNVWTPTTVFPAQLRRPVLFFIHGGGNQRGSPNFEQLGVTLYDGAALAQRSDAVVVTVSYRLGALGFLTHPALSDQSNGGASGNYGLLDQIEALRWVQNHIAAFGGDPERVTIFGESAGARNVCSLVASPVASGLFHGAIMQSGGCRQRTQAEAQQVGIDIAESVGCSSQTDATCLRSASVTQLLDALGPEARSGAFVGQNIGPVVDNHVLLASPEDVIAQGAHNLVPLVIGANTEETGQWIRSGGTELTEERYTALVRGQFGEVLGSRVLAAYPVQDYATPTDAYVALSTDSQFVCPARRVAQSAAAHAMPVYVYRFAKRFESTPLARAGAFHGIELFYLFQKVTELEVYEATGADSAVEVQMADYWGSFAATSDPNAGSGELAPWAPFEPASDRLLWIEGVSEERVDPRAAQCDFWRSLRGD